MATSIATTAATAEAEAKKNARDDVDDVDVDDDGDEEESEEKFVYENWRRSSSIARWHRRLKQSDAYKRLPDFLKDELLGQAVKIIPAERVRQMAMRVGAYRCGRTTIRYLRLKYAIVLLGLMSKFLAPVVNSNKSTIMREHIRSTVANINNGHSMSNHTSLIQISTAPPKPKKIRGPRGGKKKQPQPSTPSTPPTTIAQTQEFPDDSQITVDPNNNNNNNNV